MASSRSLALAFLAAVVACHGGAHAFAPTSSRTTNVALSAEPETSRRAFLGGLTAAIVVGASQPAEASYSAYANREKDWQERTEKGEVKLSSARDLRRQLQEIAPMNDDGRSKIFCPNGPSAAVSPLMENKCGDRMAIPSVYGRQDDALGNSVPGFKAGYDFGGSALSTGIAFPQYKENEYQLKLKID